MEPRYQYGEDIPITVIILSSDTAAYTQDFFCENEALDDYFRNDAPEDPSAVTYLFRNSENGEAIACVTIACSAIFSRMDDRHFKNVASAMEVLYFGVDEKYKHLPYKKGSKSKALTLSHYIFSYMIDQMYEMSHTQIGAEKIVLYSVPEAIHFYERCDFVKFGDTMLRDDDSFLDGCVPMYYNLN